MAERIPRLAAGLSLSTLLLGIGMAGQLVSVPVLLGRWGNTLYGEWLTLTTVLGSLSLLNLGVQSYVGNILITHVVRGEATAAKELFASTLRLYAVLCSTGVIVTFALAAYPGIGLALGLKMLSASEARVIVLIQGTLATYGILGGLLMGLFRATGQLPRQLGWAIVEKVGLLFVPIAVALGGGGPLAAALGVAVAVAGIVLVELRDVFRRTPFTFSWRGGHWGTAIALLQPSLEFFAVSGVPSLLAPGVVLILSRALDARAVATFATAMMTVNLARTILSQQLLVLWPEIRSAYSSGVGHTPLPLWLGVTQKGSVAFAAATGMGIALLGPEVISWWTRGRIEVDSGLCGLLAVFLVGQTPGMVLGVFGLALGRQRDVLVAHVVTVAISLAASLVLVSPFGIKGVAAALAGGHAAGSACLWLRGRRWPVRFDGESPSHAVARLVAVAGASAAMVVAVQASTRGVRSRLVGTALVVAVMLGLAWLWSLTKEERSYLSRVGRQGALRLGILG